MQNLQMERIAVLEKRQRLSLAVNVVLITLLVVAAGEFAREVHAQQKQDAKTLVLSELTIVDSHGVVRARLGGNLPDANKTTPRGSRIAGLLLYDETGQERGGYVTFEPGGNVGLTLDNKGVMAAEFLAGPDAGSAIRLHWADDAVELRVDEDGPSIHAVRRKKVAFHEPPVENPRSTVLCKELLKEKASLSMEQLLDACRARSSEAACQACFK
ncbi:MAG: hypothetical protein DMG76_20375 [Acidobacteria bacterium]|nr:MAG: hypothetical protein DMG76_20375 [Acidobacteriota bacterium]